MKGKYQILDIHMQNLCFLKYVKGREESPNWNLSYTNHWDFNVSRHTWQTSGAGLQETCCMRLSALLGRNSHTQGEGVWHINLA